MKVLFISSGDFKYGASKSMLALMINLKQNYDVVPVLLTKKRNSLNDICDKEGIENHSFWYCDVMAGAPYTNLFLRAAKHTVKYFLYLFGVITRSRISKLPLKMSEVDIIHTNLNRLDIGAYLSQKHHIPHVWHIRELGEEDYNVIMYKPNFIEYMNGHANQFIAISDVVMNAWVEKGIYKERCLRIYNGINSADFIQKQPRTDSLLRLVITGHIQPNKGQLVLVEAIGLLPKEVRDNVRLDIIGEAYPDYRITIEKRIQTLNLREQVRFLGYCNNIPEKLSEYDIGVTCSTAEGFGRVTIEYMLAGLAVIASNSGANPELIDNKVDGLLYQWDSPQDLADKIKSLFLDREKISSMANVSKLKAETLFSLNTYTNNVYKVYEDILSKRCETE